jgi:hypothetical protein
MLNGSVAMMISDASTEDWAVIGVKIQAISLLPQGGGSPVNGAVEEASFLTLSILVLARMMRPWSGWRRHIAIVLMDWFF